MTPTTVVLRGDDLEAARRVAAALALDIGGLIADVAEGDAEFWNEDDLPDAVDRLVRVSVLAARLGPPGYPLPPNWNSPDTPWWMDMLRNVADDVRDWAMLAASETPIEPELRSYHGEMRAAAERVLAALGPME